MGEEEMNLIDIGEWLGSIEENNIDYCDGDFFPHESIWKCMKNNLTKLVNSDVDDELKYQSISQTIEDYSNIIESAYLCDGKYIFEVDIFNDSRSFAKYFFKYLENTIDDKYGIRALKERVISINNLIEEKEFPLNDFHEGILIEWLNIYSIIYEE